MEGKVLITGASGFVGCRVVERLFLGEQRPLRAMTHSFGRSGRLARLGVELVEGDLMNFPSLKKAIEGCDTVVHCAYGSGGSSTMSRRVTAQGTANLVRAAVEAKVRRFVHVSSAVVYGYPRVDIGHLVREDAPYRRYGNAYADGKIGAEKAVLKAYQSNGLPAVVLRPAIIYGPFSTTWTVQPLQALAEGAIAFVGDGNTAANTVYIDNLVNAILLALERDAAVGHAFNISDGDGTTWRDFYNAYARMLGLIEAPSISVEVYRAFAQKGAGLHWIWGLPREIALLLASDEFRALGKLALQHPGTSRVARAAIRFVPWLYSLATGTPGAALASPRAKPGTGTSAVPSIDLMRLTTAIVRFDTTKSRNLLGAYQSISFVKGMELTARWAESARLIRKGDYPL